MHSNGSIHVSCCGCTVLPLPLPFGSAMLYLYIGSSIVVLAASILDPSVPICDPIATIVEHGELGQISTKMDTDEIK